MQLHSPGCDLTEQELPMTPAIIRELPLKNESSQQIATSLRYRSWSEGSDDRASTPVGGRARLLVERATCPSQVLAAQRLRYSVFALELGAQIESASRGIDEDHWDEFCEHLLVRDQDTDQIVGTYRVLTPTQAQRAGGYYSETEFDLSPLKDLRPRLVEFGRSCVHPDYRSGPAIMLLWSGLAEILRNGGWSHVLGCATVSLRDGGSQAALVQQTEQRRPSWLSCSIKPYRPLGLLKLEPEGAKMPPLIKGYLRLGAMICGEAAWDAEFNAADFPMILSIPDMGPRHRLHFGFGPDCQ